MKSGLKEILETLHINSFLVFSIYFNNKVREKLNLRCLEENTEYKYDYASGLNKLIYIQNCVKHLFHEIKKKKKKINKSLTLLRQRFLSYRNYCIDLLYKSMDWILYDKDLRHERVEVFRATLQRLKEIQRP